jgi:chloramphenicol O-acetyltransferase type A
MNNFERRRDRFELFNGMDSPAVNLSFTMELPDFRPWCKAQNLRPFHVLLHAVLRSVMQIENFRYRVLDGEVICIDRVIPSYTVTNLHNDLNFAMFDWTDDLRTFVGRSVAAGAQAAAMTELNLPPMTPREGKEQVFITCIPWLDIASIQHPMTSVAMPDIPSLAWGRFRDGPDGKLALPFSVQAHHGFVDGFHIYQLARRIADILSEVMSTGHCGPSGAAENG